MSQTLWNDIDAYLKNALETDMGASSPYATLKLSLVEVGETYDPDWVCDDKATPLRYPFCLVRGLSVNYGEDQNPPHGDGGVHYDPITYAYDLSFIFKTPLLSDAKNGIQELMRRARQLLADRPGFGNLQASDGEIVYLVEPRLVEIEIRGLNGVNQGQMLALGRMELDVMAESGLILPSLDFGQPAYSMYVALF